GNPAEGERCRAEADDFPIVRTGEAPNDVNRVRGGIRIVERRVKAIERWLQLTCRKPGICHSTLYDCGMRRPLVKALVVLATIVVGTFIGGYAYLRRSLPTVDGAVSVAGISAPLEIIRDADAIPHVYAATKADALFGLGYVHAQDRLWQMEFQR